MKRFEIKGIKESRGSGAGWATKEDAEGFFTEYILTGRMGKLENLLTGTVADVKVCEFDFQFGEPEIRIEKEIVEEQKLMPLDDEDKNGGTVLVKTGNEKIIFNLFVDGNFEGSFPTEEIARKFADSIGRE
jgi:hypothetical protein